MNNVRFVVLFLFVTLFTISAQAQTNSGEDKLSLNSGTIDNQFEYVIRKSNNYQDYKVVKKNWLYSLKAHTLDSLKAVHKNLTDTQAIVDNQAKEISSLKTSLTNTQGTLDQTNIEKDSMSLFGMQMSKSGYNVLLWSIIGGLFALLLLFIYKYKNSNSITRNVNKSLSEIEEEFEEHRKVALDREQKVRRQLQDELNKQKPNS